MDFGSVSDWFEAESPSISGKRLRADYATADGGEPAKPILALSD